MCRRQPLTPFSDPCSALTRGDAAQAPGLSHGDKPRGLRPVVPPGGTDDLCPKPSPLWEMAPRYYGRSDAVVCRDAGRRHAPSHRLGAGRRRAGGRYQAGERCAGLRAARLGGHGLRRFRSCPDTACDREGRGTPGLRPEGGRTEPHAGCPSTVRLRTKRNGAASCARPPYDWCATEAESPQMAALLRINDIPATTHLPFARLRRGAPDGPPCRPSRGGSSFPTLRNGGPPQETARLCRTRSTEGLRKDLLSGTGRKGIPPYEPEQGSPARRTTQDYLAHR